MNTLTMLKARVPFTKNEHAFIVKLLQYAQIECVDCNFFNWVPPEKISFYWLYDKSVVESGVLGAWSVLTPNSIYITDQSINAGTTVLAGTIYNKPTFFRCRALTDEIMGVVLIHELIHKFQFKVAPIRYILNRLFTSIIGRTSWLYQFTIEHDAEVHSDTNDICSFFKKIGHAFSLYHNMKIMEGKTLTSANSNHRDFISKIFNESVDNEYKNMVRDLFSVLDER